MGNTPAKVEAKAEGEKKLKPCCACPETKKARDACIIERGEEHCTDLIEAHKTLLSIQELPKCSALHWTYELGHR
ncbi:hypothetical protein KM043_011658 [Ampulex compressa]|nr:hypothetical protein KM043_011658 [Ampulex compressa]